MQPLFALPLTLALTLALVFSVGSAAAQHLNFPHGEFPLTDSERRSIEFSEIRSGGPMRDGIPPIDKPTFVTSEVADDWLADAEPVIALTIGEVTRAYPLQILMFHEIVNDTVAGIPVAVTFCPLCNASIVFERAVDDTLLDFGTTGRLRRSDLVMYDRQSESWWQQFTGRGIVGKYTDVALERRPSSIVAWGTVREAYPNVEVLSRETGFGRPYGSNPYRGYDRIDSEPFLFDSPTDPRLPPMERVIALPGEKSSRLITLSRLGDEPVIDIDIDGRPVTVFAATRALSALDQAAIADSRAIPAAVGFDRRIDGRTLTFTVEPSAESSAESSAEPSDESSDDSPADNDALTIHDDQTGSRWDAFGRAVEGKLAGKALEPIDLGVHFAFAWFAFEPEAEVLQEPE